MVLNNEFGEAIIAIFKFEINAVKILIRIHENFFCIFQHSNQNNLLKTIILSLKKNGIDNNKDDALHASFVPSLLREGFSISNDWKLEEYVKKSEAVLLWLDVYNFSTMCNRIMKEPESGVHKISSILQEHYDFLLEIIIQNGGTPLFFVGDGLMAFWPTDSLLNIESIRQAINCAFEVLEKRRTLDDENELISIHAVIAYGSWKMTELNGPHSKKLFSYYGEVFNELRSASKNRAPNKVLIRDSAIELIEENVVTVPMEYNTSVLVKNPFSNVGLNKNKHVDWKYSKDAIYKINKFIPTTLNLPLSRERLAWLSEVRPVSVVFVRFDNSNENTEEKLHDLDELAKNITPLVEKYDGLLNMIWMDEKATNVLICFGPSPSAHIDNPLRSVKLAIEMKNVLKKEGYDSSIGIGSGIAYCGVLGNDNLRQYTIIGDVVNLSARYASIRTHGIVCDETTYKASRNSVEFESEIKVQIKGESEKVKLYPIISVFEGVETDAEIDSSATIGREKELDLLVGHFNKTNSKRSPIAIIEGESGMGKSTLRNDFLSQLKNDKLLYSNSAIYIERKTPYYIWSEIISMMLGMNAVSDHKEQLLEIQERFGEKSCLLNVVLHTSFPESEWFLRLTSVQKVDETHDLLVKILSDQSAESKLIIMLEDAHWIDEVSVRLIESINSSVGNIFLILSIGVEIGKKDFDFSNFKDVEHIRLKKLDEVNLKSLLLSKIGVSEVSDEIVALTLKVAKGNPFFSLEFINSLLEDDLLIIESDICELSKDATMGNHSLPETVRGAIRRRIDKMDSGSQLTLKVGSVVGYKFGKEIIGDIYPILNERHHVNSYLEEAKSSGFLDDTIIDNFDGYLFNNSAIADISYESILADQKKYLHEKSAVWYEKNFEDNLQPFYVRLSDHWNKAGEKGKSIVYFKKESTRLFTLGFVRQALMVGLEGLKILNYNISLDKEIIGSQIGEYSNDIQMLMKDLSISELLDHKKLDNKDTDELIEMLLYLSPLAHQCHEPELFALLSVICLKLTLEEGNGALAAKVYAMYAIIFKAFTGDSNASLAWSNLAIALDEKNKNTYKASVTFIHGWFIAHWMKPIKSLVNFVDKGADAGFESGDLLYACFNLSLSVILQNAAGIELTKVVDSADQSILRNGNQVINAAFHLKHEKQMARAFQGKTKSYTSLSDDLIDEDKEIAIICESDMYNQIGYYLISKLKLNSHYGNWQEAIGWGDKAYPLLMAFMNQPGQVDLEFYYGLACLYQAYETAGEESDVHMEKANVIIEKIGNWSELCPENFSHKLLILKAVKKGHEGEAEKAKKLFEEAAVKAESEKFYQDTGLAYEHLVRMNHKNKEDFKKVKQKAIQAYGIWGANAKIDYLEKEFLD